MRRTVLVVVCENVAFARRMSLTISRSVQHTGVNEALPTMTSPLGHLVARDYDRINATPKAMTRTGAESTHAKWSPRLAICATNSSGNMNFPAKVPNGLSTTLLALCFHSH